MSGEAEGNNQAAEGEDPEAGSGEEGTDGEQNDS